MYFYVWMEWLDLKDWVDLKIGFFFEVWSEGFGWYVFVLVEVLVILFVDYVKWFEVLDIYLCFFVVLKCM